MNKSAEVSIIIPNLNSPVIDQVVEAVKVQCEESHTEFEVLIIGQDRPKLVKQDARVRLIKTRDPETPAKARNIGVESAQGTILIFLDADCIPADNWFSEMLKSRAEWPDAGAISGSMQPEGSTYASVGTQIACFHEHLNTNRKGPRRLLASFSLLMEKKIWERVGGFDPALAISEDVDLSVRLAKEGLGIYLNPNASVRHLHTRNTMKKLWDHAKRSGQLSIQIRLRHSEWFGVPWFYRMGRMWWILAPGIALMMTLRIYFRTPGLLRFWRYIPCVLLNKLGWCIGAGSTRLV
jgi:GT2 family glycosyltransferase